MTLNLEPITQVLALQQGLRLAIVYGSCAKGLQRPDSDLDITVDMGQGPTSSPATHGVKSVGTTLWTPCVKLSST